MAQMYTVEDLKSKYKKFPAAKQHFGVKAASWVKLCEKLNGELAKDAEIAELRSKVAFLQAELTKNNVNSDLDLMLTDLVYKRGVGSNEIFESDDAMKEEPDGTGRDDWAYFESVLRRRYHRLSKVYHPDNHGSNQQMNNLAHAYDIARTLVNANEGMGK
ncbi:MAG: J domain-containing protein [Rhizonema sp. NSF051]|nr:J domain-containing protein [Rhizonema sp. NSF051]